MSMLQNNPWRCLAAYKEPKQNDKESFLFCGREKESHELYSLVKSNLFVTLYGRTGIGKTSLLEAGVFPLLRKDDYIPIVVRFSMHDHTHKSFAEIVVSAIENQGLRIERTIEHSQSAILNDTQPNMDYLWSYFATRHFYDGERKVFPVVVLDQFEENLISFRKESKLLLEQVYSLIDDNKDYPLGYHSETNFRFILSIREDELFRLEETIDKSQLLDFKSCRYRLTHLSKECAEEVICKPGRELLPDDEKDKQTIIDGILAQATDEGSDDINTLLLSLVCSCLYDRCVARKTEKFSLVDISSLGNNLLVDFYESLPIKKRTRKIIETKFIDAHGRRNAVNINDSKIGKEELENLCSGNKHILQKSNKRLELVHDLLAQAIFEAKNRREKKNFTSIVKIGILVLVFVIFVIGILGSVFTWSETGDFNKIQLFPETECNSDSIIENISDVNKRFLETINYDGNKNTLNIYDYPNLKRIRIKKNIKDISISNCPNLRYLELPDSVRNLIISKCPQFKILYLPKFIEDLRVDQKIDVIPLVTSKYIVFNDVVWDLEQSRIVYSSENKSFADTASIVYPLELSQKDDLCYDYVRFINNGSVTNQGFLVDKGRTYSIFDCCDGSTCVDLSDKFIKESFRNAPNLSSVIIDKGTHFFSSQVFKYCPNFCKLIIKQSPDFAFNNIIELLDRLGYTKNPIVYELQGDGPLKKTADGVIYYNHTPVLISAESKKEIEFYHSNDTIWVCMKGWFCTATNRSGTYDFSLLNEAGHPRLMVDTLLVDNVKFSEVFPLLEDESSDVALTRNQLYVYCGKLSPKPRTIRIDSPEKSFVGLDNAVKKEITLIVPYGQIDRYLYNNGFDGFKDIQQESLFQTLWYNTIVSLKFGTYYLINHIDQLLILMSIAVAILLLLWYATYSKIKQEKGQMVAIFKSLYSVLSIILLGVLTWISVYWLCWYWIFCSSKDGNITSAIIAILFALLVVTIIYNNFWIFLWRKLIARIKVLAHKR